MRGADITQGSLFTTAKRDDFVPDDHPLRAQLLWLFYSIRSERLLMEHRSGLARLEALFQLAMAASNRVRKARKAR